MHDLGKSIPLLAREPLACRLSSAPDFYCYRGTRTSDPPRRLGVLTLCWSYIMSMRLLELQRRPVKYSNCCLRPTLATQYVASPADVVLDLGTPASCDLVRWLCAVLAPGLGWKVGGSPTMWTACSSGDIRFVILTDKLVSFDPDKRPPNSSRATNFLIELCDLFGLGTGPLPPCTAAFLAALALPLYRMQGLQPQLLITHLDRQAKSIEQTDYSCNSSIRCRSQVLYDAECGYYRFTVYDVEYVLAARHTM